MLKLKIFEEYNQYYTKISRDEYLTLLATDMTPFDLGEISQIKNTFEKSRNNWNSIGISIEKSVDSCRIGIYKQLRHPFHRATFTLAIMYVNKLEDEWFVVSIQRDKDDDALISFQKCDQIEGLLQLIKDLY